MTDPGEMIEIVIREEAFVGRMVKDQKEGREGQEQDQTIALGHGTPTIVSARPVWANHLQTKYWNEPVRQVLEDGFAGPNRLKSTPAVLTRVLSAGYSLTIALISAAASGGGEELKIKVAVSALFTAAALLTPAYATTIYFTANTVLPAVIQPTNYPAPMTIGLTGGAGYITAFGYQGMFPKNPKSGTAIAPSNGASEENLTVQNDLAGTEGLGVANSHQWGISSQDVGFIAPTDAVVLDFANVKASVTTGGTTYSQNQVTFNVYQDYAGADYEVYGLVSGEVNGTGANRPVWAPVQTGTIVAGQPLTVSTSSFYTEYAIGVTDCAIDIESVDIQYSGTTTQAPESGTFVLVGIAMMGLGMTVRKRKA